jgi:HK97 gp10 family phage protein
VTDEEGSMANRVRLRITGLDELRHAVKAYGQQLVASSVDAVTDAVEDTVIKARYLAPVKTGELRDSIKGSVATDGYSVRGTARATAKHAAIIEFGTQRVAKKPFFLAPAIANRQRLNRALGAAVRRLSPDGLGTPRITGEGASTPGVGID